MLGVKKHRGWKYIKFNKIWTPLMTLVAFTLLLCLVNFELLVYELNKKDYESQTGVIAEQTTDTFFFTIPMDKITYSYNNKDYEVMKYNNLVECEGSTIKIWVNKKAPNYILIQGHSMNYALNKLLLTLWVLSLFYLIRFIVLRQSVYFREFRYYKFLKVCRKYAEDVQNERQQD